jgi:hypothetical protein
MLSFCLPLSLIALLGAGAIPARAEDSLSIEVSSGGVSLGSYQGGYLLAKTLCNRDSAAYRILTGASAGAINMLGGLYYCFHDANPHPNPHPNHDSAWTPYTAWLNVGWEALMPERPHGGHLFTTDSIEKILDPIITHALSAPNRTSGSPKVVWLGFAITRFHGRTLKAKAGELTSPKMDEKIVIGIQWLAKGNPACPDSGKNGGCWRAWTEVNRAWGKNSPQPFLDFGPNGTDPLVIARNLRDLALASSAFPVAFPRHGVRLALLDTGKNTDRYAECGKAFPDSMSTLAACPGYRATFDPADSGDHVFLKLPTGDSAYGKWRGSEFPSFSDGGIFENEPLHLAQRIRELLQDSYPALKSVSSAGFVLPLRYDTSFSKPADIRIDRSEFSEWSVFWVNRQSEAQGQMEVSRFLEQCDYPKGKFKLSKTSLPLAGEHFLHFSAFFRREFRDFDFTVGLRDGFQQNMGESLSDKERLDSAQALLRPLGDGIAADLGYLWKEIDSVQSALAGTKGPPKRNPIVSNMLRFVPFAGADSGIDSASAALRRDYKSLDPILDRLSHGDPARSGPERLRSVLRGSLKRMQGTLEDRAKAKEETDGDRFESFSEGYATPVRRTCPVGRAAKNVRLQPVDSTYFLGRSIADSVYQGVIDLIVSDDVGIGNSILYPFALYHARAGIGFATGAVPSFHTPYIRIDGAKTGFRLMQGLPLLSSRIGTELGLHFLAGRIASRFEAHGYLEFSWFWWLGGDVGVGLETPADYRNCWVWPRADLVFGDILTIGMDFQDGSNLFSRGVRVHALPVFSIGSRIGFDFWRVSKGSLRGTNDDRRVP